MGPPGVPRVPILGPVHGMFSKLNLLGPIGSRGHSHTIFSNGRFQKRQSSFHIDVQQQAIKWKTILDFVLLNSVDCIYFCHVAFAIRNQTGGHSCYTSSLTSFSISYWVLTHFLRVSGTLANVTTLTFLIRSNKQRKVTQNNCHTFQLGSIHLRIKDLAYYSDQRKNRNLAFVYESIAYVLYTQVSR